MRIYSWVGFYEFKRRTYAAHCFANTINTLNNSVCGYRFYILHKLYKYMYIGSLLQSMRQTDPNIFKFKITLYMPRVCRAGDHILFCLYISTYLYMRI